MPRDRAASITAGRSQTVMDSASPARRAASANDDPTRPAPTIAMRLNFILAHGSVSSPEEVFKMPWRPEPANSCDGQPPRQSIAAGALIDRIDLGAMIERHRTAHFRDRDELRSATHQ